MKNLVKLFTVSVLGGAFTLAVYKGFIEEPQAKTIIESASSPAFVRTSNSQPIPFDDFTLAAEKTVNSVVHVKTAVETRVRSPFELFFGQQNLNGGTRIQMGSGSGVIISNDGYIVTNNHVIENAKTVQVVLNNENQYEAHLIGTDPTTDIALLKIETDEQLPFLTFSNSDEVRLGEWVLAVGNPFNLTSTVTAGIVSAKSRSIGVINEKTAIESFIQTDAAVNPGNSGGALVNTKGELIGINSAISTRTGSYEGYSFAVPANIVKKVVEDLLEFGTVQRAFIGVNIADITPRLKDELDLSTSNGIYVGGVTDEGAAEKAGIETGDIIVAVNDQRVMKTSQLTEIIGRKRPGDKVSVTVNRNGQNKTFDVVLRNAHGDTDIVKAEEINFANLLGGNFRELNKTEKARLGITFGVLVTQVNRGILAEQGVPESFIITHINRMPIRSVDDINASVQGLQKGDPVVIQGFTSTGRAKYYAFGY